MSDSTDAVGYELRGPAAWLTLQRPEKRNAIDLRSPDVIEGLTAFAEGRRPSFPSTLKDLT